MTTSQHPNASAPVPAKRPRGRPFTVPGGKSSRIELRLPSDLADKAQRLADAAGLSRNAWIEQLIDAA